jgi:hypothetical protein
MLLPALASTPPGPTLMRVVETAPTSSRTPSPSVSRSRRKMSEKLFVSPAARLLAAEEKATNRPSALIDGQKLPLLASAPVVDTLTRVTCADAGVAASRLRQQLTMDTYFMDHSPQVGRQLVCASCKAAMQRREEK